MLTDLSGTPDPLDCATTAQGDKADTAVQQVIWLSSSVTTDLSNTPDPGDYATAAQGALANSAVQPDLAQ